MKIKGKISAFIAAFCIVLYLIAMIQAAVRFYFSIDQRKITADAEFSRMKNLAVSTGSQGFMDERFVETMHNALLGSEALEALIITGPDGEYAFEKQKGRAITWVYNSPRFINRLTFSNQSYNEPLSIDNLRNVNIKAVASAFDYNEISRILKGTLLLIFIGFAIAFFTMLLQLLLKKPDNYFPVKTRSNIHSSVTVQNPPTQNLNQPPAENTAATTAATTAVNTESDGEPKGLYSSRSNIGWEEYIFDRLDAELHRCATTEQDLSLVLIEFTAMINDDVYKKAAEETVSFLSTKDMIFEFGDRGICTILPGIDINGAIGKSEKFFQRIIQKFENILTAENICIGISSRAGRLIKPERIMLECIEALKRAKNDPGTAIIAFKSDPDKYRAYVNRQG